MNSAHDILLSICIPTYNRASTLLETLTKLVENPEIDERVEIIVSDNASTDNTCDVVARFENVKYFCNSTNIKDKNFEKVLSYAKGCYVKITNDTTFYKPGAIALMLEYIERYNITKPVLYFCPNTFNYKSCEKRVTTFDDFLYVLSVNITWTNVFGMWREQFEMLDDKFRMVELQFSQVDWSLRNFDLHQNAIIVFSDFLDFNPIPKKGGYNLFEVFIKNYTFILKEYLNLGKISKRAYNIEYKRLFLINIKPWIPLIFVDPNQQFTFERKGVVSLIFNSFYRKYYFWISLPSIGVNMIIMLVKKNIKYKKKLWI